MIAVFLNNIVPYHHARWNACASLNAVECLVIEITSQDTFCVLEFDGGEASSYRRATLFPSESPARLSKAKMRHAVQRILEQHQPELVCLNGYSFLYNWVALDWCCRNRVPAIICSESNEFDEKRQPWKEAVKRLFLRHCTSGLAGGRPQADYLRKLGLPADRIFTGYDVVDNGHFATGAATARALGDVMRKRKALPPEYFMACSRFGRKKNIPFLIEAYARYRERVAQPVAGKPQPGIWDLIIVGDGEERPLIERKILEKKLGASVHLVGAKPYDELPTYYGLASAFIHASTTEQWGLVVNEALASGLPVLISKPCGCVPDLVHEGVNGFTFDPGNVEDAAEKMLQIATHHVPLSTMGNASREIIAGWGAEKFAAGMSQACEVALSRPRPSATWLDRALIWILSHR